MVVDRRAPKDPAAAGHLEVADLQDYREQLDDEQEADHRQQQHVAAQQRNRGQAGAERERADPAHEHARRVDVEPEERQDRTDHRRAGAGQRRVAAPQRDRHVGREHYRERAAGQPVEAVDQVRAGGRRQQHQDGERHHPGAERNHPETGDPDRLAACSLTVGDVIKSLREQNLQVSAGSRGQPAPVRGRSTRCI